MLAGLMGAALVRPASAEPPTDAPSAAARPAPSVSTVPRPATRPAPAVVTASPTTEALIVLGRYSTSYAHDAEHRSRAFNVELSAQAIDGKVLLPGATFSFNDAVGERTASFGFAKSIVLRDGLIAEGTGGGACQVASTLHAAALLAGLEIVARAPHSRPSAYIRMGLDATVALGGGSVIDLKVRNATAAPLTIRARATRGTLDVWMSSGASAVRADVSVTSEIVDRFPIPRTVERDARVPENTIRIKAFGIPGYRVKRRRIVRLADGTELGDVRTDLYPATSDIVVVSPSFDATRIRLHPRAARVEAGARAPAELPVPASDETPPEPESSPPTLLLDPGVARPALVQLRPSTLVRLDNAAP